jgi:excisionase family DNA binding protein
MPDANERREHELSLQEAADLLDVHYMTAYRYVRTGRLVAERRGKHWYVPRSSIATLREANAPGRNKQGGPSSRRDYTAELAVLLVEGDEAEAWRLSQNALASAFTPEQLYLDALAPAMRFVGDQWETGRVSIAEEHRASALAARLVGRLGPLFTRRGPTRGLIVLGTPTGDRHGLATALLADPLRGRGFSVGDLGADTPAASFAEIVASEAQTIAAGIAVSVPVDDHVVSQTIQAVRSARNVPVLLGGRAIADAASATRLGADAYSDTAMRALAWFEAVDASA